MQTLTRTKDVNTAVGTVEALNFQALSGKVFDGYGQAIEGYQRIWRPDSGKTLAIMSDSYKLVEHREAMIPAIEALGIDGWKVNRSHIEREGASAFVELERRDQATTIVGEPVGWRILMRNTYDGTSNLRLSFGALVLVCSNGLVLPGKQNMGFDSAHIGGVRERLGMLTANVRKIEAELGTRMIHAYTQLDKVVPKEIGQEIVKRVVGERKMDAPIKYWRDGIGRDGAKTAWNLYNGITQYLTHDFIGGWGRRERKNAEALELVTKWVRDGSLPKVEKVEEN